MKSKFDVLHGLVSAACEVNPEAEFPIPAGELLELLGEMRGMAADFAALKAVVVEWKSSRAAYKEALDLGNIYTSPRAEYRHRLALGALISLIDRLEPKRSPVLEIAGINHE